MPGIFESYLQPRILSPRFRIRKIEPGDAAGWEAFFSNNPNLRFFGLDGDESVEDKVKIWLDWQFKRYDGNRFGLMALIDRESGGLVGNCGLLAQDVEGITETEVAYHILPQFWRRGYASEAAKAFKQYAFDNDICDSVISIIHPENIGSQKVALSHGLRFTGETMHHSRPAWIYRQQRHDSI